MATHRGMDGALVLGGILDGSPLVNGALAQGATSMNIDAGSLNGVVFAGDKFTLAGESGSPQHTVTGGPYVASGNAITGITFTPPIATGGVADNAAVTFVANSVAQILSWEMGAERDVLDASTMGDKWRKVVGGMARWSGEAEALLDYGDAKQKELIDKIATASPASADAGLILRAGTTKQFYGSALLTGFRVVGDTGTLFRVSFQFSGSGSVLPNWV